MNANRIQWCLTITTLLIAVWFRRLLPWTPLRVAGVVLCILGFAAVSLARYQLGQSFSVTAEARHLVTIGLYSRLRNPIYLAGMVFLLGVALLLQSWWIIALMVVVVPVQILRTRREVVVLEAAFGDRYRIYRTQTWF